MKRLTLLFCVLISSAWAFANVVEIDGIYYNLIIKVKEAEVVANPSSYYSGNIVIPDNVKYNGEIYNVTSIEGFAFCNCSDLTSIVIPSGVVTIGEEAFYECKGLTSVTIPNSVTTISLNAFNGCSGLTSVTIPNSVISIGNGAFYGCSGLISVTIGNGVTSIGSSAFYRCYNLTSITIGTAVTTIGESVFLGCNRLTSIIIPNSVVSIGSSAFSSCSNLTSVTIGNGVTSIGSTAFSNCSSLTSVHISDLESWCKIGFAYYGSNPLEYAHHLFMNGKEITDLVIPNGVTSIGSFAFYGCSGLTSVTIPNSVTAILLNAFMGCNGLTSVTIPNSVTTIYGSAFYGCSSLTSVTIGDSNNLQILDGAFAKCQELSDVYCYAEKVPSTNSDAFTDSYIEYATLHIPTVAYDNYKNTEPWSGFGNIVILESEDPVIITAKDYTIKYGDELPTFDFTSEGAVVNGTPTITCDVTKESPVGTYPIVITKGSVENYNVTYVNGTLTIEKTPLTITAKDYTIKQGEALPTFEANYEGFKNDETSGVLTKQPVFSTTATSASEPGDYDIIVSGAEATNYDINYVAGKLTITEADPVTITAKDYTIKYGDELPAFDFTSDGAVVNGTPSITCDATKTSPVGTYPIVISNGGVTNYNVTYVNGTLTIEKTPLTITAKDYTIKQGEALPTFEATYEGFKNDETATVLTKQPIITTTATSASESGDYDIIVSSAEAQNYDISYVAGKLTIAETSRIIGISVDNPMDIYDLQGNKVRYRATSLDGLPKGVYIVNNKKIVIW